jgi:hypothetical protein
MQILVRSVALFLFVWIISRAIGRKELAELSSFELILLIVMGDLIQQGVTGDDRSVTGAMLAVATFALLTVGFSYAAFRSSRIERLVEGRAVIVVKDGTPLDEILAVERLTVDEVKEAAREQSIADLPSGDPGIGREIRLPTQRRRSLSAAARTGEGAITIPDRPGSVSAAPRPGRGEQERSGTRPDLSRSWER